MRRYLRLLTTVLPYHCEACKYLVYSFHLVVAASSEYIQQTTYNYIYIYVHEIKLQQLMIIKNNDKRRIKMDTDIQ